jgi:phosphoribosyl-ATP pyrophosphohydrolase/phosphoribosyl-AMP cyclohydrolase
MIDFQKMNNLVPIIVQDKYSLQVLMLGYMNEEAYEKTLLESKVTFFSRSKNRLWTKGETSNDFLLIEDIKNDIKIDCDNDTILIKAMPQGNTCHTGKYSCFEEKMNNGYLYELEKTITQRIDENVETSYTNKLYKRGINKVAQKVGEEAVELVIEAKDNDINLFKNEAADLLYHFLILLKAKNTSLVEIEAVLRERQK